MRAAEAGEAGAISALALRSKGHWGYDAGFLAACREDLTIRPEWCDGVRLVVAEQDGVLLGYARVAGEPPSPGSSPACSSTRPRSGAVSAGCCCDTRSGSRPGSA